MGGGFDLVCWTPLLRFTVKPFHAYLVLNSHQLQCIELMSTGMASLQCNTIIFFHFHTILFFNNFQFILPIKRYNIGIRNYRPLLLSHSYLNHFIEIAQLGGLYPFFIINIAWPNRNFYTSHDFVFVDLLLQMCLSSVPPLPLGIFFCLASNFFWLFMMLVGVNPSTSNFNRFLVSMCQLLNVHALAASRFSLYASFAATQHLISVCTLFLRLYP